MKRLLIVAVPTLANRLSRELQTAGFTSYAASPNENLSHIAAEAALVAVDDNLPYERAEEICRTIKIERKLPLLALVGNHVLASDNDLRTLPCDDLIIEPYEKTELLLRIWRLAGEAAKPPGGQIVTGDLVIDTAQAEVYLSGKPVDLTFREYELLSFLASHPGRMYSRDALLNHVWGYDYFGGDRTVDVHVRRLRSKIEDAEHSFIDTVRNMGYRFRKQE
jgi:DNA-binding response OmpR family regulator